MPTCLRNWKAIARGYGSKLFSHEDFCCPKCTHMKPGLLLIKIVDETRDLFWAVVSRRFPEGSCAEGKHSNSVSARQCASTLDRHTGSGMAGGKKWKQGMQENTCNRLWECLDISSGIRKRKKKEGRNEKGKKRLGSWTATDITNRGTAWCMRSFLFGISCVTLTNGCPVVSSYSYLCMDWLLMMSWQRTRAPEKLIKGVQQHLDIKELPVPAKKNYGIYQEFSN